MSVERLRYSSRKPSGGVGCLSFSGIFIPPSLVDADLESQRTEGQDGPQNDNGPPK
jgi:hypothetical protein